jgi:hypothetical protein
VPASLSNENFFKSLVIPSSLGPSTKSPTEAVAEILELRKGVRLGGLKIKDLMRIADPNRSRKQRGRFQSSF